MEDRLSVKIEGGIADVRLARAEKLNAFDDAMFAALVAMGERLKEEKNVRAVVLSGEGRAFSARLDMDNFAKMASGERRGGKGIITEGRTCGGANRAQQAVMVWRGRPGPGIAAVHGVAFWGGPPL